MKHHRLITEKLCKSEAFSRQSDIVMVTTHVHTRARTHSLSTEQLVDGKPALLESRAARLPQQVNRRKFVASGKPESIDFYFTHNKPLYRGAG